MAAGSPRALIVTTQTWLQVSRLAIQLHAAGCRVAAICPDESPLAFLPEVEQRFRFSPFDPPRSLRSAIAASSADYVVPTDDLSTWLLYDLSAHDAGLQTIVQRSLGDTAYHPVLSSRSKLLAAAAAKGIRVAPTTVIRSRAELDAHISNAQFPFVLKKDGTWGGQGVHVVRSAAEAVTAYGQLERRRVLGARAAEWLRNGDGSAFARPSCMQNPEVMAQEFVDGVPANSMYACHKGVVLGEVQARVAATRGKTGPSIVIELMDDARIQKAGELIADQLRLSGFFGLDFMLERTTGEPFLIECNARATQLGHVTRAGFPSLVQALASQWTGIEPATGDKRLGGAIWFYPDGMRLTENSSRFPGFRPDSPEEQMDDLERRMREQPPTRVRLRRSVWKTLSRLKGSVALDEKPKAYYYPSPESAAGDPPTEHRGTTPVFFHPS